MAILFLGDFLYDYENIQEDISSISKWVISKGYQVILNLEAPITENYTQKRKKRGPNLAQSKITIEILKSLNVVGVCLANNHMMDYGEAGLINTIELLDKNNILHTGAGVNLKEASVPMHVEDGDTIYEIYNFGWDLEETVYADESHAGCSPRESKNIYNCIRNSSNNYKKIAVMHWGFEYHYLPMPYDIMLAHNMIDVGYNTIIGHHPHVVQPFEMYKDKYVFYSIGNFFMGTRRNGFNDRLHEDVHGAGILLENDTFKQFDIKYDMQKTTINEFSGLGNITGIDFKTRDYSKMCRKNAKNYTPILTNNILLNHIKILNLKIIYFIYGQFRFLKKRR